MKKVRWTFCILIFQICFPAFATPLETQTSEILMPGVHIHPGLNTSQASLLPQIVSQDISSGRLSRLMVKLMETLLGDHVDQNHSLHIYFEPFELQSSFAEINEYRKLDLYVGQIGWPKSLYENAKKTFYGWTYHPRATMGRSVIQMSPRSFDNELTVDPRTGVKDLRTGNGYQTLAHELAHAVLYQTHPELDEKYHHCMFHLEDGFLDRILQMMVSEGLIYEGTRATSMLMHRRFYVNETCTETAEVRPSNVRTH